KSGSETFSVQCVIESCQESFIGVGASRRKAEQGAAERAFEYMSKLINPQ
ncbi:MAG: putative dsRNA-binding protein, partial [Gammaproteobacteria bacterium]